MHVLNFRKQLNFLSSIGFPKRAHILLRWSVLFLAIVFLLIEVIAYFNANSPPLERKRDKENRPPPSGYLTIDFTAVEISGLCNKLFELLAAIGIADKLNRIPYINVKKTKVLDELRKKVSPLFPFLERKFKIVYDDVEEGVISNFQTVCCFYNETLRNITTTTPPNSTEYLRLEGQFFQSYLYFDQFRDAIRDQWLVPNRTIQNQMEHLIPENYRNHFLICAHVRRGDFVTDNYHSPSEANFAITALNYLWSKHAWSKEEGYKKMAAAILGDDMEWKNLIFGGRDNIFIMNNTLEQEFAFTKRFCDVVLITAPSSTFGWFMGYLSRNPDTVVYYRDIHTTKDKVGQIEMTENDYYLPHWIKLKEENGEIKEIWKKRW